MVTNLADKSIVTVGKQLAIEEKVYSTETEIVDYSNLVKLLEKKMLPIETTGKYILIKLSDYSVPISILETFYEVQLLGYVPVIASAELNADFRKNPNKLYTLVTKGALVQINESSIVGKNGKAIRKFTIKLCRHNLVHLVSSVATVFTIEHSLSKKVYSYLRKKISTDYVNYLQSNAKHVWEGTHFHPKTAIKFK